MSLPFEHEGGFIGELSNRLRVMARCDELAAAIGALPQRGDELPDLRQRKVVVRFVPRTDDRRADDICRDDAGAQEEALLPLGERFASAHRQ